MVKCKTVISLSGEFGSISYWPLDEKYHSELNILKDNIFDYEKLNPNRNIYRDRSC